MFTLIRGIGSTTANYAKSWFTHIKETLNDDNNDKKNRERELEESKESDSDDDTKYVNIKFKTKTPTPSYRFVFDTGAEVFSIGYRVFNELIENGLEYEDMNIIEPTVGVSGIPMDNKVIKITELTIGEYKVKNVIAFVETLETATSSLLGIGFMKKFKNVYWSLNDDQLILFK